MLGFSETARGVSDFESGPELVERSMAQGMNGSLSRAALERKHDLILSLERELGVTVARLEAARTRQVSHLVHRRVYSFCKTLGE